MLFFVALAALASASALAQPVIVQLFEWKFSDIATECRTFLGPYGYKAVQVSPVHECAILDNRPWYERYQPISYNIISRSGDEQQFKEMVSTCNKAGVRIYVDVVFNHMTGNIPGAHGMGGSTADPGIKFYPAVPFNASNFHPTCDIDTYQNANEVRNCELLGLHDLNQTEPYVREKIIGFLNKLIDHGVAGFRIDAAKHMWPSDLNFIYSQLKPLNTNQGFKPDSKPFIYQEVIDMGGEAVKATDYTKFACVVDFKYSHEIGRAFGGNNQLKWLRNFGPEWSLLKSDVSVPFVDNHDNQRDNNPDILTYKRSKQYKMAVGFMLAWPQGNSKRIMSSYDFSNKEQGPPHNPDFSIADVKRNPDLTCGNGWICEHRWRQIYQMVGFNNIVQGSEVTNFWDNGNNQIAFCRGSIGFVAFNGDKNDLNASLMTCLPPGSYCDIISGLKVNNECTGKYVDVGENGIANITLKTTEEDGLLAIHLQSRIQK